MNIKLLKYYPAILLLLFFISNCAPGTEQQIEGQWKAHLLTEDRDTLRFPPNDVQLIFLPDKTYEYHGTLRYREAGQFRAEGRVIYTTDTLSNTKSEKAVHIERLTGDTMVLNMVENKKHRRLELHRLGNK